MNDDFEGNVLDPMWAPWGSVNAGVSNGHGLLRLSAWTDGNGGIATTQQYDLTGCAVWLEVGVVPLPSIGGEVKFELLSDSNNNAAIGVREGSLWFVVWENGTHVDGNSMAYQPAQHRWLRFRDDQGRLRLETSPDAADWAELTAVTTPWWINAVEVGVILSVWGSTGDVARTQFDNLNQLP